jgi:hypothetical protein
MTTACRVVLLGASNVAGAFPTLVETARRLCGGPLDVLTAFGNGRSYGQRSRWLFRELPGIAACGLWDALERRPAAPTVALLTDVGNDLLYEVPVPEILGWVEACMDRLGRAGARVVLTPLPLPGIRTVSPATYHLLRTVTFPRCRLDLAAMLARAEELDRRLRDLARGRGLLLVEPRAEWYGFDRIHLRRGAWPTAWPEMLSAWSNGAPPAAATLSFGHWLSLRLLAAEQRWLFGLERRRSQPAATLPDGTTLALY